MLALLVRAPRVIRNGARFVYRLLLLLDKVVTEVGEDAPIIILLSYMVTLVREDCSSKSRRCAIEAAHGVEGVGSRAVWEVGVRATVLVEASVTTLIHFAV